MKNLIKKKTKQNLNNFLLKKFKMKFKKQKKFNFYKIF